MLILMKFALRGGPELYAQSIVFSTMHRLWDQPCGGRLGREGSVARAELGGSTSDWLIPLDL